MRNSKRRECGPDVFSGPTITCATTPTAVPTPRHGSAHRHLWLEVRFLRCGEKDPSLRAPGGGTHDAQTPIRPRRRSADRGWATGSIPAATMQYHAYNRLGSGGGGGGGGTPSPPASPRRSPRVYRRGSGKGILGRGGVGPQGGPWAFPQRMVWMLLSLLLRRQAIFLFAPLLYVSAMLVYMGTLSIDSGVRIISRSPPGSVYRSPRLYERLRPDMDADNSTDGVSSGALTYHLLLSVFSIDWDLIGRPLFLLSLPLALSMKFPFIFV